ncbi:MAG: hypothetical protein AAF799_02190 [Myxococcota bacterium]
MIRGSVPLVFALLMVGACASPDSALDGGAGADTGSGMDSEEGGTEGEDSTGEEDPAGVEGPTWNADIAPLVQARCGGCHDGADPLGGLMLTDYEQARTFAGVMAGAAHARTMPPWGAQATDSCTPQLPWLDDPSLTDDEIEMLQQWADAGAPFGDPDAAAPLPPIPDGDLADANLELSAGTWTLAPGVDDEFRCYPLSLGLQGDQWLEGLSVEPNDPAVVHHAVFFYDEDCQSEGMVDESGSYECFGGAGVPGASVFAAWTPGSLPTEVPPGSGIPVAEGSCLVMQTHYHPSPTEERTDDGTVVKLRVTDTRPQRTALINILGAFDANQSPASVGLQPGPNDGPDGPEFLVPAGASDHLETLRIPLSIPSAADVRIWSVLPHQHVAGKDIRVRLERDGEDVTTPSECLVGVPDWDFNWQRSYQYDAPFEQLPPARDGDILVIECGYDNSESNERLMRVLMSEQGAGPGEVEFVDMPLGDNTLDEMCVAVVGVVF